MSNKHKRQEALDYHAQSPAGKISIAPTKRLSSQIDLALAYSPGVAEPCTEIAKHPDDVYKYTAKGNLVAVITNGTAVLGLGNIGASASKPVMEGKGVLFKKFADIDVFDIEVDETDPDRFIAIVKALEPTFGGINLEDIKAPESFYIEDRLREEMNIPVMHDDQHGTAIISGAALLNALELIDKKIEDLRVVVSGAGAAAMACLQLYIGLGVRRENLVVVDSRGVIRSDRDQLSDSKAAIATDRNLSTLAEALVGADMFLGLSRGNVLSAEMLQSMASDPLVFALANPDPEIEYSLAMAARGDIIMATGRSDHPNQVNNVLGFPYIFRGALDVRARSINEEMKLAAVHAIAALAKEPVPDSVIEAYGNQRIRFGKEYLIPKPLDPRLITTISPAVARAAIETGVSRIVIDDWQAYEQELQQRIGLRSGLISQIISRARQPKLPRVVFGNATHLSVLKAARMLQEAGIGLPILLGNVEQVQQQMRANDLVIEGVEIIDPYNDPRQEEYVARLYDRRKRKGMTLFQAQHAMQLQRYFAPMMVEMGEATTALVGLMEDYSVALRSILQVIGLQQGVHHVAGAYILSGKPGTFFLADTSVNISPDEMVLAEVAELTHAFVTHMHRTPRLALLSYSNFGSSKGAVPVRMRATLAAIQQRHPDWVVEGDIQADVALSPKILQELYGFSSLKDGAANTLIFPNLASGNIAYKLLMALGEFEAIGPVLLGLRRPVYALQQGALPHEIFHLAAISLVEAKRLDL